MQWNSACCHSVWSSLRARAGVPSGPPQSSHPGPGNSRRHNPVLHPRPRPVPTWLPPDDSFNCLRLDEQLTTYFLLFLFSLAVYILIGWMSVDKFNCVPTRLQRNNGTAPAWYLVLKYSFIALEFDLFLVLKISQADSLLYPVLGHVHSRGIQSGILASARLGSTR